MSAATSYQVSQPVALQKPRVIICPPHPRIWTDSPCCLIPQGLRPEKRKVRTQEPLQPQSGLFLMGSQRRGAQQAAAAAADTQPPTKPQTLSIFSGTKRVCGMRSPTQLPLEQEQEEWGGKQMGFTVSSAGQCQSGGGKVRVSQLHPPPL